MDVHVWQIVEYKYSRGTAGLLKRQQSEKRELSLDNESFKLKELNWLLRMPPGYAHDKKNFKILKVRRHPPQAN